MTPLDRAARAALDEFGVHLEDLAPGAEDDIAQRVARAVLEAIREPSEGMVMAACGIYPTDGSEPILDDLVVDQNIEVYQRMIDAALGEG